MRAFAGQNELTLAMVELQAERRAPSFKKAKGLGYDFDVSCDDAVIDVEGCHIEGLAVVCLEQAEFLYD